MKVSATGILWYRTAKDYADMRAILTDADSLQDTYEDWLAQAEQVEKITELDGGWPVRAYMDPSDFPKWCQLYGCNVDSKGCQFFASWYAARAALER